MIFLIKKKHHRKSRQTKLFKCARDICNLHSCCNFALALHESALVLSQSDERNFSRTLFHEKSTRFKKFQIYFDFVSKEHVGLKRVERSGMFDESYS